jgi:hypothetical protein
VMELGCYLANFMNNYSNLQTIMHALMCNVEQSSKKIADILGIDDRIGCRLI